MQIPIAASSHLRAGRSQTAGFTLIELVAAIVIVGAIVAVALPIFRDLRYDARRAALEGIRVTMVANATLARNAWMAQGGGSNVQVNGRTIQVFAAETTDTLGRRFPAGAPTAAGMYAMLDCGTASLTPTMTETPCTGLPGYLVAGDGFFFAVWQAAAAATWGEAMCFAAYWATAGHDPSVPLGSPYDEFDINFQSSNGTYYRSVDYTGGC